MNLKFKNNLLKLTVMKKTIYLFASALTVFFALSSCKTDVTDQDTTLNFSTLPVEQQKKSIEQSGLDLADRLNGMKETQAFKVLDFLTSGQMGMKSPALVSPLKKLRAGLLKNDVNALENFNKQMSSVIPDSLWGTYNYNHTTNSFDPVIPGTKNKAIFNFPADSAASNNNGSLTINYAESTVAIPDLTPEQKYPQSISVVLKVNGTEALNAQYTGSFATDGTPTSILQTLVIGAYNWSISLSNTTTDISASYAFKYNSEILLKYEINAKGNFTATKINDSNTNSPEDVFSSGNVTFQIMNIALYGGITDLKSFMAEGKALKPDSVVHTSQYENWTEYIYSKSYYDAEIAVFNKYLKFYGYFASEKQKFADVEFFTNEGQGVDYSKPATLVYTVTTSTYNPPTPTVKYDYYYYDYVYNPNTQNYDYKFNYYLYATKTVYNAQPRLVLSDGSKVTDFEAYANDNFKTVIDKFQAMFNN